MQKKCQSMPRALWQRLELPGVLNQPRLCRRIATCNFAVCGVLTSTLVIHWPCTLMLSISRPSGGSTSEAAAPRPPAARVAATRKTPPAVTLQTGAMRVSHAMLRGVVASLLKAGPKPLQTQERSPQIQRSRHSQSNF